VDRIFAENISFEEDLRVLEILATIIGQALKLSMKYVDEKEKRQELTSELIGRYTLSGIVTISDRMHDVIKTCIKWPIVKLRCY